MNKKPVHEGNALNKDITAMTMPLFVMAFFYYGPRVLLLALAAVATARLADRAAALMRGRAYDASENSSLPIALIIVLMMPATVRYRVVIGAVLIAVLVAKEAFGGAGSYPFNPSAVGFCVAAVSWSDEVFKYPQPSLWLLNGQTDFETMLSVWRFEDATLVSGASGVLQLGALPNISILNVLLGNYAGPLGVSFIVVIAACVGYLLVRRHFPLAAPASFLVTVTLIAFLLPRGGEVTWSNFDMATLISRLTAVGYELSTGALIFAAAFLVNEPGTLPKNTSSRIIYGVLLGFATMMFRYYGTYELGACFAFLLVNAISGYFDRALARGIMPGKKVVAK